MIDLENFASHKIVSPLELINLLSKASGNSIILKGAYDILHSGHILSFLNAKEIADILIVCIASDASIRSRKGNNRPYNNYLHRVIVLSSIETVDYILQYDDISPYEIIKLIKPTYFGASHLSFFNENEKIEISKFTKIVELPKIGGNSVSKYVLKSENMQELSKERKLNLHLRLNEDLVSLVKDVNKDVKSITNSIIDFDSEEILMIPHITIIMGYLDETKYSIKDIIERTVMVLRNFSSLTFTLNPPYIESSKNNYIFSDIEFGDDFRKLQNQLFKQFETKILKVQTDFNKQPHLTLGHITSKHKEISEMLNAKYKKIQIESKSISVELSDVGTKGTCANSLWTYDLQ